jgi:hypothetical protein
MKALTICQPYAELILRQAKRVENRTWHVAYRGAILIHAGKSREWLELDLHGLRDETYEIPLADMDFGAIVGVAQLRACIHKNFLLHPTVRKAWPWLPTHEHAEGPFCWILEHVFRFSAPIPYRGARGLFDIPAAVVAVGLSEAMAPPAATPIGISRSMSIISEQFP